MKITNLKFIIFLIIMGSLYSYHKMLWAGDVNTTNPDAELDKLFLSADRSQQNNNEEQNPWKVYGFIESVNHYRVPWGNRNSNTDTIKNELRLRTTADYEHADLSGRVSLDAYLRLDRIEDNANDSLIELDLQEAFINKAAGEWQCKAGKQLFSWGNGDVFHVTNYMDQMDLRQLFAIDNDDQYRGVYALSAKHVKNDFAVEIAYTPFLSPVLMPKSNSYWALELDQYQSLNFNFIPDNDYKAESSYAIRAGGVRNNIDYHFSFYHGISNTVLFKPTLTGSAVYASGSDLTDFTTSSTQLSFETQLFYDRVNTFGFDIASSIGKFSYRLELAYTPDMFAFVSPSSTDIALQVVQSGISQLPLTSGDTFSIRQDFVQKEKEALLSWVLGFDYNYRGTYGLIYLEWTKIRYLNHHDRYISPVFEDILLLRWEDRFIDDRLKAELGVILSPVNSDAGYALRYELAWDLLQGWEVTTGGFYFTGNEEDILFELVDQKDMMFINLKYEF